MRALFQDGFAGRVSGSPEKRFFITFCTEAENKMAGAIGK